MLPEPFPSFFLARVILLRLGWLTASHALGATSLGSRTIAPVLAGKRLELLKETVPKLSRVALLWNPQLSKLDANNGKKSN